MEENDMNKRRRKGFNNLDEPSAFSSQSLGSNQEGGKEGGNQNKVKSMASQLLAKFEENSRNPTLLRQESIRKVFPLNLGGSDTCYFCKKRVYVMQRLSAEGHFFHRECFRCSVCGTTLRLAAYAFDGDEGKFFCKPHFVHCKTNSQQRKRRAELKQQKEEEGMWKEQEAPRRDPPPESSCAAAAISMPEGSPPGIPNSFFRKALSWSLRLPWGLFHLPRRLLNWIQGLLRAASQHIRDNAYNYCYTYELLSLGLPLLWVFSEALASMYRESEESLESIRDWLLGCFPDKLH